MILGAKKAPKGMHFGSQNGAKSESKTMTKKISSNINLEAVLDRSWVVLSAVLGSSWDPKNDPDTTPADVS